MDGGSAARIGLCCSVAAAAGALFGGACGDGDGVGPAQHQAMVRAICDKLVECGCSEALGIDAPLDCNSWTIPIDPYYGYDGYGYYDSELPTTLDVECLERYAHAIEQSACDGPPIQLPCEERCQPYFGPLLEGQPCEEKYACGRGLFCSGGECRGACTLHHAQEGERCDSLGCEPGFACGLSLEFEFPVCARLPGIGEPCDMGDCIDGARCGADDLCVALSKVGQSCMGHRECDTVYCPAGFCAERPQAGSPCGADEACAEGTACAGGVCVTAPPLCSNMLEVGLPFLGLQ